MYLTQLMQQCKRAAPAKLFVAQVEFAAVGAMGKQVGGTWIGHDIQLRLRIFCMQGLHDRCRHDGITDIAEGDQQDPEDTVTGSSHLFVYRFLTGGPCLETPVRPYILFGVLPYTILDEFHYAPGICLDTGARKPVECRHQGQAIAA